MKKSSYVDSIYELHDSHDLNAVNNILNLIGIHVETDLFSCPYVILDQRIIQSARKYVLSTKKSSKCKEAVFAEEGRSHEYR